MHRGAGRTAVHIWITCAVLSGLASCAGGHTDEEDHGIRITAPMQGWTLPSDRPIAVAYFAIWPPCTARPDTKCTGTDTCKNPRDSSITGGQCETRVVLNGQHMFTHDLTPENQFTFSGALAAGSLPPGTYKISITYVCKGPRQGPLVQGASSQFSVVNPDLWEELGDEGEVERLDQDSTHEQGRLRSPAAHVSTPYSGPGPENVPDLQTTRSGAGMSHPNLRCAVMIYHANVAKAYEARWMEKSMLSILSQTHEEFDIFELNYGSPDSAQYSVVQPFLHLLQGKKYTFHSVPLDSHAAAMNLLLDKIFAEGYDVTFNVNIDDYYAPTRFERQLAAIALGAHLVSCEFVRITADASGSRDRVFLEYQPTYLSTLELFGDRVLEKVNAQGVKEAQDDDIRAQLASDHNVMCHPGIAFTRRFWHTLSALQCLHPLDVSSEDYEHAKRHTAHDRASVCSGSTAGNEPTWRPLRYRDELPAEDLRLWQRALLMSDIKAVVVPEVLVYYRIHERQISPLAAGMDSSWHLKMTNSAALQRRLRVGLLSVCTGRYCVHLQEHLELVLANFLAEHGRRYYIFTDQVVKAQDIVEKLSRSYVFDATVVPIQGRGFPADTLYRYHYFLGQERAILTDTDVVFYLDVDLQVVEKIRAFEVVPLAHAPLVAVRHMLQEGRGTPETRKPSRAYIDQFAPRRCYFAGGFLGGRSPEFIAMARSIQAAIDDDDAREVVAIWHDESHLNKYMSEHGSLVRVLSPSYLYPQGWNIPFQPRILVQKIQKAATRFAQEAFVAPCGVAPQGKCALGPGLGETLFSVAAAVGLAEALNVGGQVGQGKNQEARMQVLLPLTWCFGDSPTLCDEAADDQRWAAEIPISRVPARVSYRNSWLWSFRRCDKFARLRVTAVHEDLLGPLGVEGAAAYSGPRHVAAGEVMEDSAEEGEEGGAGRAGGALMLVGSFYRADVFHPSFGDVVKGSFRLPETRQKELLRRFQGIRSLFEVPVFGVHLTSWLDFEFFQATASERERAGEGHLWLVICSPAAGQICAVEDTFMRELPAIYVVGPERYDESEALGLLSMCHRQLVTDALSWWAAYLSPVSGPRVVFRDYWELDDDGGQIRVEDSLQSALQLLPPSSP